MKISRSLGLAAALALAFALPKLSCAQVEIGPERVTFEAILADPDNVDLNYRYARSEVESGNLRGAVSALQRILAVNPNHHQARLFYAIVLFRLGDYAESEAELQVLGELPITDGLRNELGEYQRQIRLSRKSTHLSGYLSGGVEYDDNRNAAPATGRALFGDTQVVLNNPSQKREDTAFVGLANIELHRDLGTQAGDELFTTYNYYRSDQTNIKSLNLQAHSFAGGGCLKTSASKLTASALFDHILLAQTTYLRNRGGIVKLEHKPDPSLNLYFEGKDVFQDFSATEVVPLAAQRSGAELTGTLGADYRLNPTMKLGFAYSHVLKHAVENFDAFVRDGVNINHTWLLGQGMFLYSYAGYMYDVYPHPEVALSNNYRRDNQWRAGFNFGVPITMDEGIRKDLIWTFGYEYYQATSTLLNYSYTNNKVTTLLTYRWELGV